MAMSLQILRAELAEKRELLAKLRQELEISRESWKLVKKMTADSEREWRALRSEFAERFDGGSLLSLSFGDRLLNSFFKFAILGLFDRLFTVFSNEHCNFLQQYNVKNVHPVSGAGIRTHNLFDMSLLPLPLDHCSRPSYKAFLLARLF